MPAAPGQEKGSGQQDDSITLSTFSGLRNTVNPERLGERELARAQNIDLDDDGQAHLRRGQTLQLQGQWHSLYRATYLKQAYIFGVNGSNLCLVRPDYSTVPILGGMPPDHLSYEVIGRTLYFSALTVSGQVDLLTGQVSPWGFRTAHDYYPSTAPEVGQGFWYSPVTEPNDQLPSVAGRFLGPVPMAKHIMYFNGRMYLATGNVLWATELYAYNYVDKTSGYRQFEDEITGMACVEDGIYVGTASDLFFVAGSFKEQKRVFKESSRVIPGTMITVPEAVVNPENRGRSDIPPNDAIAVVCMTTAGVVVGMAGGKVVNLTRSQFKFPGAVAGKSVYREQDGFNSIVTVLESGGTPTIDDAMFGDYVQVTQTRNGVVIP